MGEMSPADREFVDGYLDGRNLDTPVPSSNRSHCYRHSFSIGRAERRGVDVPSAAISRERARRAERLDGFLPNPVKD